MCQNHWTIVFRYGAKQVTATKHRGYDLKWRRGDLAIPPSVILKFESRTSCPPMSDVAWRLCATEYPDTRAIDCSEFCKSDQGDGVLLLTVIGTTS